MERKFCLEFWMLGLYCKDGSLLPEFILKMHRKGTLFPFVIDALRKHKVRFGVVVEDVLSEGWCRLIGLPIRRAIYGIFVVAMFVSWRISDVHVKQVMRR